MNLPTFIQRRATAQFFAGITIVSLLLSAFPAAFFVAEAATGSQSVQIDVEVMPNPNGGNSDAEYVSFTNTHPDLYADLSDYSVYDLNGELTALGVIPAGGTFTACADTAAAEQQHLSLTCDTEYSGHFNNSGPESIIVKNSSGDELLNEELNPIVPGSTNDFSFDFDFDPTVNFITPANGDVLTDPGTENFVVEVENYYNGLGPYFEVIKDGNTNPSAYPTLDDSATAGLYEGPVDLSSLTPGDYVFKVLIKNNQPGNNFEVMYEEDVPFTIETQSNNDGVLDHLPDFDLPDGFILPGFGGENDSEGNQKKVTVCQANGNGGYVEHEVSTNSITNPANGNNGINQNDIIPPFAHDGGVYEGQNWDSGQTIWENGCQPTIPDPEDPVEPEDPETPQVCSLAGEIISYTENPVQNNGQPVKTSRRDLSALDSIGDTTDFFGKESPFTESDFFSLGITGEMVYEFTNKVAVDQAGDDIAIWEVTGGTSGQTNEQAEVFFSEDGVNYESVGVATGDAAFDIADTSLEFVKFVKLVDQSTGVQGARGDGFDVDAITIIDESCADYATVEATKIICEDESLLPNGGYESIDENTANEFLASLDEDDRNKCRLATEEEFTFQWALGGQRSANSPNNDGDLGDPWYTPVPTMNNGVATMVVTADALGENNQLSVREVMDTDNYLPFSGTNGGDETAEFYCHTDAANFDNLDWVSGVQTDTTYHCVGWNVPLEKESDVTVCKYDESENPLSGWQLSLLGEKMGEVAVQPDGEEYEITGAPAGDYVLKASNAYVYRPTNLGADAAFSERKAGDAGFGTYPYQPWRITQTPNEHLGVKVNGDAMVWGNVFNPDHVYYTSWNPTDPSNDGVFQITDTQYRDNSGEIMVEAFAGYTGMTGENGCVTFEDVPYGEYEIEELMQMNWENVSGLGSVTVDEEAETFSVVNRDLSETPVATVVAEKIVCEAEEYLPNWNDDGTAPHITADTAADYVAASDGKCELVPDWEFEWGPQNASNPDSELPDTAFYGAAGGAWTTFGPTDGSGKAEVSLTADEIDGDGHIWVREVLQEDYIPFTYGPGNKENDDNETAEFYCHTDGQNYDNYDRVDGIAVDSTYHCVAFNTAVEKPVEQCTLDIYSDEMTLVEDTNELAVATYDGNDRWTADIPGATWVWATERVDDPEEDETNTFVETFTVSNPTSATLDVAHDNWLKLYVNGELIADRTGTNGYQAFQQPPTYDILSELVPGENRIEFEVTNEGRDGRNYRTNPAGVLYQLSITGDAESCERTTEPESDSYLIDGYKYEVNISDGVPTNSEYLYGSPIKEDWEIELYDGDDELVAATTTDENGYYYFEVESGDYEVREVVPSDWTQIGVQAGDDYVFPEGEPHTCEFTFSAEYNDESLEDRFTFATTYDYDGAYGGESDSDYRCDFYNARTDDEEEDDEDEEENDEDEEIETFSRSGGSTGTRIDRRANPEPQVLGETVSQCEFLNDHMQMGSDNDQFEVMKLQLFLQMIMGYEQPVTGTFGAVTDENVKRFQEEYRSEILDPWYERGIVPHNKPTGFVYKTTKWKINDIVCPGWDPYPSFEGETLESDVARN